MSGVAKDVAALYEEHGRRAVGSVVTTQLTEVRGATGSKSGSCLA